MKRFDAVIEFLFGRNRYKKLTSPSFPVIEEIIKDYKISIAIPRYGKNYFKLTSTGGLFTLFIRSRRVAKDMIVDLRSELKVKYNEFGIVLDEAHALNTKSFYCLDIDKLLPYIDSIVIDKDKVTNKVSYLFRFIESNEELNIDGYLKVTGLAGKRVFEKYNAMFLNLK